MATIRKRGNRYHVQVRRKGFPTQTRSFLKLNDAKEWARHRETQADRQELLPDRKALGGVTLKELVVRYRDEVVPWKKGADVEGTVLEAFLRHDICGKKLADLTTADFASYRDERLKEITPKSLRRQLSPLSNMFNHAREEWGVPLRENPLSKLKLTAAENRRERRLREGELERIIKAANGCRNPFVLPVVLFALETAMRRGEILSMTVGYCGFQTPLSDHSRVKERLFPQGATLS